MKIKLLITGLLGFVSVAAFAQKGELNSAKENFDKYEVERANKITLVQGVKDLADAKTSIDKASVNEKTASLPLTWAVKGSVYAALTVEDTIPANSAANFKIADEALTKAKVLDSVKHENKSLIQSAYRDLAQYSYNNGVKYFQNKKYFDAYKSFDYYSKALPENDTTALYVTGLSAANAALTDPKYYPFAISSYTKLLATNYSQNTAIYNDLSSIYLANKDTTNALKVIGEGVAKYPANNDLRTREIQIGLQSGKQDVLISKIEVAIAADPKNKTLYYYEAVTFSQIALSLDKKEKKATAAEKVALQQKKLDNYAKAAEQEKKALAIDPNYFDANLNMALVLLNPALEEVNAANNLPANKQKEYAAAVAKANTDLDAAKIYIQKAVDIDPKSTEALTYLKTYYLGKQDVKNANLIQKKIEALGGQ